MLTVFSLYLVVFSVSDLGFCSCWESRSLLKCRVAETLGSYSLAVTFIFRNENSLNGLKLDIETYSEPSIMLEVNTSSAMVDSAFLRSAKSVIKRVYPD